MFQTLNIVSLLFLIGAAHALWVVGSTEKIQSACKGKHLRHISIHPTDISIFSVVCTSGATATIAKVGQTDSQVQKLVDDTKGTIKVLMPYYISKKLYFAVILEPKTNAVSYWYWGLDSFELNNKVRQTTGSITSFVPYVNLQGNRVYCIVATKKPSMRNEVFISKSPEEINARANGGFIGGPKQYRVESLYLAQDRLFDALLTPASKRWFYVYGISEDNARKKVMSQGACISAATASVDTFGKVKWAVTSELCPQPATVGKNSIASQVTTPGKGSGRSSAAAASTSTSKSAEDTTPEPSLEIALQKSETTQSRTRNFNSVTGNANSFSFSFSTRNLSN